MRRCGVSRGTDADDDAGARTCHHISEDRRSQSAVADRSADHDRQASERPAVLHPDEQASRRSARSCGSSSTPGSVLEDDDQRGLAHFVEHMAFNGTKHFPKQDDRQVHGVDRHAVRAARQRVHELRRDRLSCCRFRPTSRTCIDQALLILEDWAHDAHVRSDPRSTRSAASSWKNGGSAAARTRACATSSSRCCSKGSRYADRLPIGKHRDSSQNFKHERLKQFYADWYRPDLMAVVAVGDFDKAAVETLIKQHFGIDPAGEGPEAAARVRRAPHQRARSTRSPPTRKPTATIGVACTACCPARDQTTVGAYRQQIVEGLFASMLSARFCGDRAEAGRAVPRGRRQPRPVRPHRRGVDAQRVRRRRTASSAGSRRSSPSRSRRASSASPRPSSTARRQHAPARVRARRRARRTSRSRARSPRSSSATSSSTSRSPASSTRRDLYQRFLPAITLAEVNGSPRTGPPTQPRRRRERAGEAGRRRARRERSSRPCIKAAVGARSSPPYDRRRRRQRAARRTPPAPARSPRRPPKRHYGITEWELSNGVKVVLKPTTFKEDEVVFRGVQPGRHVARERRGLRRGTDRDRRSSSAGGLGKFSARGSAEGCSPARSRPCSRSSARPTRDSAGGGSPKDLETLFQLSTSRSRQPRADAERSSSVMTSQTKALLANQKALPSSRSTRR